MISAISAPAAAATPTTAHPDFSNRELGVVASGHWLFTDSSRLYSDAPVGRENGYASIDVARRAAAQLSAGDKPAVALFGTPEGKFFANAVYADTSSRTGDPDYEPYRVGTHHETRITVNQSPGFVGIFDGTKSFMSL